MKRSSKQVERGGRAKDLARCTDFKLRSRHRKVRRQIASRSRARNRRLCLCLLPFALCLLHFAFSLPAFAAEPAPFAWPPALVYDRQVRDPKWLEAIYRAQAGRIVQANATFYHLDDPQRLQLPAGQQPSHVLAKAAKVLADGNLLVDLEAGGTAVAADRYAQGIAAGADCLLVRDPKPERAVEWIAYRVEPRPVTRAQFLLAIRSGLQVTFTRDCADCGGDGKVLGSVPNPGGRSRRFVPQPCAGCKGTGQVPVRNFNR